MLDVDPWQPCICTPIVGCLASREMDVTAAVPVEWIPSKKILKWAHYERTCLEVVKDSMSNQNLALE